MQSRSQASVRYRRAVRLAGAVVGALAAASATAQQAGQQSQQGQPDQRIAQEVARYLGAQVYASPAQVRQIQQALNAKGYDVGSVDGAWNESTSQAARNFQQAQGLEPTGNLNLPLLAALGIQGVLQGQGGAATGQSDQRLAQEAALQGTPIYVSPAQVRQVQQALNQAGYDVGAVDGQWGDSSAQAAMNYQQVRGLEPTGQIDVELLQALNLQSVLQGQVDAGGGLSGQKLAQEQAIGGTPLYLGPAKVRQIQQALNGKGYDSGAIDGQWGSATQQAARNWQQAQGLEPTGTLTLPTLAALGENIVQGGGAQQGAQQRQSSFPAQGQPGGKGGEQQQQQQRAAGDGRQQDTTQQQQPEKQERQQDQ